MDIDDINKADLVDQLAQHRTDNADEKELLIAYYDDQYGYLDGFTTEELIEMVEAEIG